MRQSRHLGLNGLHDYVMDNYILFDLQHTYRFANGMSEDWRITIGGDAMNGMVDGHQTIKGTGLIGQGKPLAWIDDDNGGHIGYSGSTSDNATQVIIELPKFNGYITGLDLSLWATAEGGNQSQYAWALSPFGTPNTSEQTTAYSYYCIRQPRSNDPYLFVQGTFSRTSNDEFDETIEDPQNTPTYMEEIPISGKRNENNKPLLFQKQEYIKVKNYDKIYLYLWGYNSSVGNVHIAKDRQGKAVGVRFYYKAFHKIKEDNTPSNNKIWKLNQ